MVRLIVEADNIMEMSLIIVTDTSEYCLKLSMRKCKNLNLVIKSIIQHIDRGRYSLKLQECTHGTANVYNSSSNN